MRHSANYKPKDTAYQQVISKVFDCHNYDRDPNLDQK